VFLLYAVALVVLAVIPGLATISQASVRQPPAAR
jgi:hypothetical protein